MTHYRSLTTGQVVSADDLQDCEDCGATGEVLSRVTGDYNRRSYHTRTCPTCNGTGKLDGFGVRGDNYAPRRVVAVGDPLMEESAS